MIGSTMCDGQGRKTSADSRTPSRPRRLQVVKDADLMCRARPFDAHYASDYPSAALEHRGHAAQILGIVERVAIQHQQVRLLAGFDGPDRGVETHQPRRIA